MLRYKLNTLAQRRAGAVVQLPVIHGSSGQEAAYLKALRKMLREIASVVRVDVLDAYARELETQRRLTRDMDEAILTSLTNLARSLTNVASQTISTILRLEAKRHTSSFMATAKRALGIDLAAVVREEDLEDLLRTAATRNAGLIKGLSDLVVQRIQNTVTTALLSGTPVKDLKKQIAADLGVADSRARLIARDQMAKLNSDLNRFRHQQAGVEKYIWRTSQDERVRNRHRALEGKIYAYGEPTGAEGGAPPGQPVQCRCVAQAIVEF